jgi:glutamate/tyrosine decarboxylase-like PLP-dependent enzyme
MQAFLELFHNLAQAHVSNSRPVSQPITAAELEKLIDIGLSNDPADMATLATAARQYLHYNPDSAQVDFFKLLYSGHNAPALLGDWVASLSNANMHTYQMSPVASLMEVELINQLNSLIGFRSADNEADGIMVSGGSQANLIAMMMARHKACPRLKAQGFNGQALVAYVSDQAHYSAQKAANILGIGSDNLVAVASDNEGRLDPQALTQAIELSLSQGKQPFYLSLTAGTTVVGAYDPIVSCRAIADQYNLWLHIDGAWGAPVLFSASHKHLLAGSELADSFTWDAHKLMNVPITAAVVLTPHKGMLEAACGGGGGDYLFHSDANAELNLGAKSIQCGRRADALKVWLSWKAVGHQGFADKIDKLQQLKTDCVEQINSSLQLHMIAPAVYLNVLFQFRPKEKEKEKQTQEQLRSLNIAICKRMQAQGNAFVDYAKYKDKTGIRLILANSNTQADDIKRLLTLCIDTGQALIEDVGEDSYEAT